MYRCKRGMSDGPGPTCGSSPAEPRPLAPGACWCTAPEVEGPLAAACAAAAANGRDDLRPVAAPLLLQLPSRFREAASVQVAMLRVDTGVSSGEAPLHAGRVEDGVEEGAAGEARW